MTLKAMPYIVVPMEVMDRMLHQLSIYRAICPDHLKEGLNFALKRFNETDLYMHGNQNVDTNVEPANYKIEL